MSMSYSKCHADHKLADRTCGDRILRFGRLNRRVQEQRLGECYEDARRDLLSLKVVRACKILGWSSLEGLWLRFRNDDRSRFDVLH